MNYCTVSAICLMLSNVSLKTYAEVYTSIAEIEDLLDVRKVLIQDIQYYVDKEKKRINILKQYVDTYKRDQDRAMRDISNYIENPISAFVLIKSLTVDLKHIKTQIKFGRELINNITIILSYHAVHTRPDDLKGAAQGLSRLKNMYNLDVRDLAEGKLNGIALSTPLSASDCYELGRVLYNANDYKVGREFMEESYRKYNQERITYPFTEIDILEHLGYGSYLLGDFESGKSWIDKILQLDMNHERAIYTTNEIHNVILDQKESDEEGNREPETENQHQHYDQRDFQDLCRGDIDVSPEISRRLTCQYLTDKHPFFKIVRVKMEMKYLNPDLVLFHDVINDKEIETLKEIAKYRLRRAELIDDNTGETYIDKESRISKTALVEDNESDILHRISQRMSLITGLSIKNNKDMQVVNYGVAGSYNPHNDYSKVIPDTYTKLGGRRIATIMFYLSDVAQGGATVFLELGVRISPVKGSALFWYNLHASGEGNHAMLHAACPVLQGSKWLLVRFFHQAGQEFRKPCNLEYQKEGFAGFIPQSLLKGKSRRLYV